MKNARVLLLALVAVPAAFATGCRCSQEPEPASGPERSALEGDDHDRSPAGEREKGRARHPGDAGLGKSLLAKGLKIRRARGPARFVVRYGEGRPLRAGAEPRTEEEARRIATSVRERVLAGEDVGPLIRQLSDPPIGLGPAVVERHEALGPGEASEVVEIENGFAVFFGEHRAEGDEPAGSSGASRQ